MFIYVPLIPRHILHLPVHSCASSHASLHEHACHTLMLAPTVRAHKNSNYLGEGGGGLTTFWVWVDGIHCDSTPIEHEDSCNGRRSACSGLGSTYTKLPAQPGNKDLLRGHYTGMLKYIHCIASKKLTWLYILPFLWFGVGCVS